MAVLVVPLVAGILVLLPAGILVPLAVETRELWIESCRRSGLGACLWSTFALVSFRLTFRWVITSHCNVSQLHREVQGLCSSVWLVCLLRCQSAELFEAEVGASGSLPLKRKSAA